MLPILEQETYIQESLALGNLAVTPKLADDGLLELMH